MRTVAKSAGVKAVNCEGLGGSGLIDMSECCERCHSAEDHALDGAESLGPCRLVLPDGKVAFVCCAARKQLLGETTS